MLHTRSTVIRAENGKTWKGNQVCGAVIQDAVEQKEEVKFSRLEGAAGTWVSFMVSLGVAHDGAFAEHI